jgi:membrane protease YdiL (CAAX protease family)
MIMAETKQLSKTQKMLNVWAVVLILWSLYRTANIAMPLWFDEFIAKPAVFILPVLWFIHKYEGTTIWEGLWLSKENIRSSLYYALGIGIFFAVTAAIGNISKYGHFSTNATLFSLSSSTFGMTIAITIATAISEEILSRGFVIKRLYEESKSVYGSAFLGSVLFLILHVPILFGDYKLSGPSIILLLSTNFILSFINSIVFIDRKNLLAPILIHAFYNIAILLYT